MADRGLWNYAAPEGPLWLSELYGLPPEGAADYEFRRGDAGLEAGRTPRGIHGALNTVSTGADAALAAIADAEKTARESGARQSPVGWLLGQMMAGIIPATAGSVARVAKAPLDYAGGRDNDLRGTDALLGLPAVGPAARAAAPAMRLSPETATMLGLGGAGAAVGVGTATAGDTGRSDRPVEVNRSDFDATYKVPRPILRTIDEAAKAARAQYEASAAYRGLVDQKKAVLANRQADDVEAAARKNYAGEEAAYRRQLQDWETDRTLAFEGEQKNYNDRITAFNNQGFWDRNPDIKPWAMGAAYGIPAAFGAATSMSRAKTFNRLADDIGGTDPFRSAAASAATDKILNPSRGSQARKAVVTGLAAGAPFEVRSIGDAIDSTFAPEGSGAQKRAREHFSNPLEYFLTGLPQLASGAILYGTGAKAGSLTTPYGKEVLEGARATTPQSIQDAGARIEAALKSKASIDQLKNAAALDAIKGRAAVSEAQAIAQEAARKSGAQGAAQAQQAQVAQPQAPNPAPQPAPAQNQLVPVSPPPPPVPVPTQNVPQVVPGGNTPMIPAGMRQNPNWVQNSDTARRSVLDWLKQGGHLGKGDDAAMKAKDLVAAIGDPKLSVQSAQGAMKRLRDVMAANGLDPANVSATQLRKFLKDLPPGYFSIAPIGAIGSAGASDFLELDSRWR